MPPKAVKAKPKGFAAAKAKGGPAKAKAKAPAAKKAAGAPSAKKAAPILAETPTKNTDVQFVDAAEPAKFVDAREDDVGDVSCGS